MAPAGTEQAQRGACCHCCWAHSRGQRLKGTLQRWPGGSRRLAAAWQVCNEGPKEKLDDTVYSQVPVLLFTPLPFKGIGLS